MRIPLILLLVLLPPPLSAADAVAPPSGRVDFSVEDGPLTQERVDTFFGAGRLGAGRDFAAIRNGALEVTFVEGKKVSETALGLHVPVPPSQDLELRFRIRYPEDFQLGLHGKQLGLGGGKGYDGGRGEEARANGDGWSIRLQFDSVKEGVRNSLYVYHAGMTGKYGGPLGGGSFILTRGQWHDLKLRVVMQSAPEAADGRIEVWCDGEKKIEKTGVQFVTKDQGRQVDRVRLEIFPGGGGEFPSKPQVIALDDIAWGPGGAADPARGWWESAREFLGF